MKYTFFFIFFFIIQFIIGQSSLLNNNDSIFNYNDSIFYELKDNKYRILNSKEEAVTSFLYDDIIPLGDTIGSCFRDKNFMDKAGYIVTSINGKYGVINSKGDVIIRHTYKYLDCDCSGLCIVNNKNNGRDYLFEPKGNYDYLDLKNDKYIKFGFEYFEPMYYGCWNLLGIRKNKKWGVINERGNIIAPIKYNNLYLDPDNGNFSLELNEKWGLFDKDGEQLISFMYEELKPVVNSSSLYIAAVSKQLLDLDVSVPQYGIIDVNNKSITSFKYEKMYGYKGSSSISKDALGADYDEPLLLVSKSIKHSDTTYGKVEGFIDYKGKEILFYNNSTPFEGFKDEKYHLIELNEKVGIVNNKLNIILPIEFDSFKYAHTLLHKKNKQIISQKTFLIIEKEKKYGVVDSNFNIAVPPIYNRIDYVSSFSSEGLFSVSMFDSLNDELKRGYIDKNGKVKIPVHYREFNYIENRFFFFLYKVETIEGVKKGLNHYYNGDGEDISWFIRVLRIVDIIIYSLFGFLIIRFFKRRKSKV